MLPKVLSTATLLPQHTKTTAEILEYMESFLPDDDERFKRKVLRIFKYAEVDRRYSIHSAEDVFTPLSFEEKNAIYVHHAREMSKTVLQKALKKAKLDPKKLDFIITVSCTGFMIPSVDAYTINDLGLRQDIVRLPVTEMGCAAGVSGMIYAQNFLKANPGSHAAIIAVESPTSTFQHTDLSMANMVSAAIFGDGAACVILGPTNECAPQILDSEMYHFYDETSLMGFDLTNEGFKMVLDVNVPNRIEEHFDQIVLPFLEKNKVNIRKLDHLIFHPGGKKIIQIVEELFLKHGQNIDATKSVLKEFGNMSSATVLFVLDRILEQPHDRGELGLMLSFGPGFSAQRILLEWN